MIKFCGYMTARMGKCGAVCLEGTERCKKHYGVAPRAVKISSGRFRGASRYAKEQGMFENASE